MARRRIQLLLAMTVAALVLSVFAGTASLAAATLNPRDGATCGRLDIALHDSAEALTAKITGAIRELGNVGTSAHDASLRQSSRSLRSATSSSQVTAALQAIGSACSRLGDPPRVSKSDQFVAALRSVAPEVTVSDAKKFEDFGKKICSDMRSGATVTDEVTVMKKKELPSDVASGLLGGSVVAYCHQFTDAVEQFMNTK